MSSSGTYSSENPTTRTGTTAGTGTNTTDTAGTANTAETLPKTASSYPAAALAGVALLGVGLLIRRRAR